jgi:hypothetical protein
MIPPWVGGLAARDTIDRARRGRQFPDRGSSSDGGGILSFLGILLIVAATLFQGLEHNFGGFLACILAALVGIAAYWTAFRARGWLRIPAGLSLSILSAYALHVITAGSGGASWIWDAFVFLLVGFDQWVLKSAKS